MLATIIPHFLIALVSDKSAWPTGPEFKFESNVQVHINGINATNQIHGLNITNEFTCRPKSDISLHCQFQNKNLVGYCINTDTGETELDKHPPDQIFEPFPFEIEFDKKGVNKLTVNETLSKYEGMLDIAKAMASALNVGADISGVKIGKDQVEFGKVQNLFINKCKGDVVSFMQTSTEEDNSEGAEWNLELNPPLEKLTGRNLNVMKTWNMSDCNTGIKFFWLGLLADEEREDPHRDEDVTTDLLMLKDRISISKGSFDYMSAIDMGIHVKKLRTPMVEKKLYIKESSQIRLSTVQPATGTWPEIENAVTIDLKKLQ